jgi:O-antigen/teichoic acid export membrane protein
MGAARRIARNTGVQVVAEALSKLASLALYVVMARSLGVEGFGEFMFALSLALLLTVVAGFGIDAVIVRHVAREPRAVHSLLADAIAVKVVFGLLGVALAVGVAFAGGYSTPVRVTVGVLAVASVIDMLSRNFYAAFQARDDLGPTAVGLMIQRFSTAAVGMALLLAGGGVVAVALVWLGGSLASLAYATVRLARARLLPEPRSSWRRGRALITGSFAIGLAGIFSTVLFRVDSTMLSLLEDNAAVGLYGVAYRLLESTLFLSFAFVAALLPMLSRLSRTSTPPVADVFELGCKVLAVMLVPLGVAFVAFAEPIIDTLYGDEYAEALTAARILGGAVVLYGFSYLGGYVLISQGRQNLLPVLVAAVAVENIALNFVLIPAYSYDGAAISTTVCEATHAALMIGFAVHATGRIRVMRILAGPLAGAAAMAGVALALGDGLAGIVLASAAYVAVLLAVERRAFPADLSLVARSVTRRGPLAEAVADAS